MGANSPADRGGESLTPFARAESAENSNLVAEGAKDGSAGMRSKMFLSFGIKKIFIPIEEIEEFITYHFAYQGALQLEYNNWSNEEGYISRPRREDFKALIRKAETLNSWMLGVEHLCLSIPILDSQKKEGWKRINEELESSIEKLKVEILSSKQIEKSLRMSELLRASLSFFDNEFRKSAEVGGVDYFFRQKESAVDSFSKSIVGKIELDLFKNWENGMDGYSIFDVGQLLDALIEYLDQEVKARFMELIRTSKEKIKIEQRKIQKINEKWSSLGFVKKNSIWKG